MRFESSGSGPEWTQGPQKIGVSRPMATSTLRLNSTPEGPRHSMVCMPGGTNLKARSVLPSGHSCPSTNTVHSTGGTSSTTTAPALARCSASHKPHGCGGSPQQGCPPHSCLGGEPGPAASGARLCAFAQPTVHAHTMVTATSQRSARRNAAARPDQTPPALALNGIEVSSDVNPGITFPSCLWAPPTHPGFMPKTRLVRRMVKGLGALAILCVLGASALLGALWLERRTQVTLPTPTGVFPVGRAILDWTDDSALDRFGAPHGTVIQEGIRQPFMFLLSDHGDSSDPESRQIAANIQSVYYVRSFFDAYLKGASGSRLQIPSPLYPEVQVLE